MLSSMNNVYLKIIINNCYKFGLRKLKNQEKYFTRIKETMLKY